MVDIKTEVIEHGGDGHSILQVFGQEPFVGHVVVQNVVQFDVDVADQSAPDGLWGGKGDSNNSNIEFILTLQLLISCSTGSTSSQASLLGAKKVNDPAPSISRCSLDMFA